MRTTTSSLTAVSLALFLVIAGCEVGEGPRVQGAGPVVSETRTVGAFTGVELRSDADLVISQGEKPEVRVEAQRNILDVLKTEVHGDTLRIDYDHVHVGSHDPVKIYVTTALLRDVDLSGSGSISSDATWRADSFRSGISGSGNLTLRVAGVQDFRTDISGSGNLTLAVTGGK